MAAAEVVDETAAATGGAAAPNEDIRPYQIHVSSRYLNLTRQKLEITRLPHEHSEPKSEDWWEPKPQVEPLIDFWLEQYSWRAREEELNALPQFRTAFTIPQSEAPVRVHFIHVRSPHANAVPLLLIPSFPFTGLSFGHVLQAFTNPEDAAANQPFHLVIPSLPGLGFSDALPNNTPVISVTAELLNTLMVRLVYSHYLVTNVGSGSASPAEIDWQLANYLATQHPDSCLGTHFISPALHQPKLQEAPIEWAKWSIASLLQAPMLGYSSDDFSALERAGPVRRFRKSPTPAQLGLNQLGLREPNTLAYALCDSPTGLLVFALKSLRMLGAKRELTPTEIIDFTQLAWLPGPEAALRYWAHCALHPETLATKVASKPKVAITVFLGDEAEEPEAQADEAEAQSPVVLEDKDRYACPSWANAKYHVVYAHRAAGKSGLLAWERPDLIVAGVRGLATEVLRLDARLKPPTGQPVAALEQVVTGDDGAAGSAGKAQAKSGGENKATTTTVPPEPSLETPTPTAEEQAQPPLTTESGLLAPIIEERLQPQREISGETEVASDAEERGISLIEKSDETLASITSPGLVPSSDVIHVDTPSPVPVL